MSLGPQYARPPRKIVADAISGPISETLRRELESLAARLSEYEGRDITPQAGCNVERMTLGDADVLVEFEVEQPDGDGWNEPRTEGSVTAIGVLINGSWCDVADVVPESVAEAWSVEVQERWKDEADAARIEAAIAAREFA